MNRFVYTKGPQPGQYTVSDRKTGEEYGVVERTFNGLWQANISERHRPVLRTRKNAAATLAIVVKRVRNLPADRLLNRLLTASCDKRPALPLLEEAARVLGLEVDGG